MEDEGGAPKEYVVKAYLLKSDYEKCGPHDLKSLMGTCSDKIKKTKLQVTVKTFVRIDIKVSSKREKETGD